MERGSQIALADVKLDIAGSSSGNISTDKQSSSKTLSTYSVCVTGIDLVNHVLIIFMTGLTLWYAFQSSPVMELHVSLCTLGYILLMSEAIVVLAGESVLTNFLSRRAKDHIHWILQVLGVICNIAGVYFMYEVKKVHFRSIHAILGLASLIVMIPLTVFGYPVLVAVKLRKLIRPVIVKFGHNLAGTLCFVLGMASQCYGYKMHWIANASSIPNVQLLTIIATALITVLSVRSSLPTLCVQLRAIFR